MKITVPFSQIEKSEKQPEPHQTKAIKEMKAFFTGEQSRGILQLPTGAGKTFTAVRFIVTDLLSKGYKVLWLAPTSHLLDQAYETFIDTIRNHQSKSEAKKEITIRVVSSAHDHSEAHTIDKLDDILIITVLTAISNYINKDSKLNSFLDSNDKWIIVVDEAHHAPAFGCTNLLIGGEKISQGLLNRLPNSHLLGLTATPVYNDKNRSGFLKKIFCGKESHTPDSPYIISERDIKELKKDLENSGFLAKPKHIPIKTDYSIELKHKDFEKIVYQHKDLPESIIEELANASNRNESIVNTYLERREEFGKTIIFALNWRHCVQLEKLLNNRNIKAGSMFSKVEDKTSDNPEMKNRESINEENFRKFKENELDVLINVKMLTEGADIPNVKSVFLTRPTTSRILFTQMIGRALRGPKSQKEGERDKKNTANLVYFIDNWKQALSLATFEDGGTDESKPIAQEYVKRPIIYIKLVEKLASYLDSGEIPEKSYLEMLPEGWYDVEFYDNIDNDEFDGNLEYIMENVVVFDGHKPVFEKFIENFLSDEKQKEREFFKNVSLNEDLARKKAEVLIMEEFSEIESYPSLWLDILHLCRHLAFNNSKPEFVSFQERSKHNLTEIAKEFSTISQIESFKKLIELYENDSLLWKRLYKSLKDFKTAFDIETKRILFQEMFGANADENKNENIGKTEFTRRSLSEKEKLEVLKQDKYTCQCCGVFYNAKTYNGKLDVDHIDSHKFSGDTSIENSQTLCSTCNQIKGTEYIDFKTNKTEISSPIAFEFKKPNEKYKMVNFIAAFVNFSYKAKVLDIKDEPTLTSLNWGIYINNVTKYLKEKYKNFDKVSSILDKYLKDNFKV